MPAGQYFQSSGDLLCEKERISSPCELPVGVWRMLCEVAIREGVAVEREVQERHNETANE